jgi:hypothetical protein
MSPPLSLEKCTSTHITLLYGVVWTGKAECRALMRSFRMVWRSVVRGSDQQCDGLIREEV